MILEQTGKQEDVRFELEYGPYGRRKGKKNHYNVLRNVLLAIFWLLESIES